jgi:O-antigen biosynthesis protein
MITNPYNINVPGTVIGKPVLQNNNQPKRQEMKPPEMDLKRGINFYADYSGCGFWRMIWPEHLLNAYQKMIIHGSTVMCFDENWYSNTSAIRIQRQATESQLKFVQYLKGLSEKMGFRLIYEIDDIIFHEDIPHYNKFRSAFVDPKIRETAQAIMSLCDEITVTCDFMKEYYKAKTNHNNITVIPNYIPKFWMGNHYNEKEVSRNFDKNRKKPRILYPGSGAHFDVDGRVNNQDDFGHVIDTVIKTRKKYQWVFLGAYPMPLKQYITSGEIEFIPWMPLYDYPNAIKNIKPNILVAPLQDNTFNRAKSDLKYIEACAYGIPAICQDIDTYQNAPFKFSTGEEMIDQISATMKDKSTYMKISRAARKVADGRWLENEDNLGKYAELYNLAYADPQRLLLNKQNNI